MKKYIKIITLCNWGERVEFYDAENLIYFSYDDNPNYIEMLFNNAGQMFNVSLFLHSDFKFNILQFESFLKYSTPYIGEYFLFHADQRDEEDKE